MSYKEDTGTAKPWGPEGPCPPTFGVAKRKKGNKGKKRNSFKADTIKRLSQRSKCYCFSNSRASRNIEFSLSTNYGGRQHFLVFHGSSTLKSISPVLKSICLFLTSLKMAKFFLPMFVIFSMITDSF